MKYIFVEQILPLSGKDCLGTNLVTIALSGKVNVEDLEVVLSASKCVINPKTMLVINTFTKSAEISAEMRIGNDLSSEDLDDLKLKVKRAFRIIQRKRVILAEIKDCRHLGFTEPDKKVPLTFSSLTYNVES